VTPIWNNELIEVSTMSSTTISQPAIEHHRWR